MAPHIFYQFLIYFVSASAFTIRSFQRDKLNQMLLVVSSVDIVDHGGGKATEGRAGRGLLCSTRMLTRPVTARVTSHGQPQNRITEPWARTSMFSGILPNALRVLLASLILTEDTSLQFNLRHEHAVTSTNHIVFANVPNHLQLNQQPFAANTSSIRTYRPTSFAAYSDAIRRSVRHAQSSLLDWRDDEVQGPDVNSRETVLTLAKMTYDAYLEPSDKEWHELGPDWNYVSTF